MPYSYIWIIAKDETGVEVPGASVMEGSESLGRTGGSLPLPLDPRVYRIHVEVPGKKSEVRRLVLEPIPEEAAPREVFVLTPVVGGGCVGWSKESWPWDVRMRGRSSPF